VGELPLFADHMTQSDTGDLRSLPVLAACSAPATGGLSSTWLRGSADDPDDFAIGTVEVELDGLGLQQQQQHADTPAAEAAVALPATGRSLTGTDKLLDSCTAAGELQQLQQQQQQLLPSPINYQGGPGGHRHAGSTASITSLGSAAAVAGGSPACGSDMNSGAAVTTAGSDEGSDGDEGMGQVYWMVFQRERQHLLLDECGPMCGF
jgi:hypothetical protein